MQIASKNQPIESNIPLGDATSFTLEANTKAFDILSSNLYQDKPEAIIRELSCNAYDSHITNGNPEEPFHLTLPSQLNPALKIRDFGTGLSHEDMVGLYTTYFGSNKRDSNSLIGGLGLGSKTPFAYCDAFAVTSYFNGVSRQYSVFKDENGCPAITLVGESETEQRNGLEIVVPIKSEDFWTFNEKAKKVLKWFPVTPVGVDVFPVKWKLKNERYGLLENSHRWHSLDQAHVLMGNVRYALKGSSLDLDQKERDRMEVVLRNTGMVIFADIGDIDIAASREALSYDKNSIKKLKELIGAIADEIMEDALKKVQEERTHYEQYQQIKFMADKLGLDYEGQKRLTQQQGITTAPLFSGVPNMSSHRWNLKTMKKDHGTISLTVQDCYFLYSPEPITKYTQWLRYNAHVFEGKNVWFLTGDWFKWEDLFHGIFPWDMLVHIDDLDEPPKQSYNSIKTSSGTTTVRSSKPVSLYIRSQNVGLNMDDFTYGDDVKKQMMSYSVPRMSDDLDKDTTYLWVESNGAKYPWGVNQEYSDKFDEANRPKLPSDHRILFIPKSVPKRTKQELMNKYPSFHSWLDSRIAEFKLNEEIHKDMYALYDQITNHRCYTLLRDWERHWTDTGSLDPADVMIRTYKVTYDYVNSRGLQSHHNSGKKYTTQLDTMLGEVLLEYPWLNIWLSDKDRNYYRSTNHDLSWKMFKAIRKECNNDE